MVKKLDGKLLLNACTKFLAGVILVGVLLFLPAGTMTFWNAWLLMGILFIPMFVGGLILWGKAPDLLRRRLQAKEKELTQKNVIGVSGVMFFCGFLFSGLDFRFGWTNVPHWLVYAAAVIFLLGYLLFAEVLRENAYLSRTIEVQADQKVVDTGLYGIVRHPMYMATLLMFLSIPLILGSWVSFVVFLAYPVLIIKRLRNEEVVLTRELKGYAGYCQKVKCRLLPYIW